jgi:branched-chain amino acid transport system permease protein
MTALPATSDAGRARVPSTGRAGKFFVIALVLFGIAMLAVANLGVELAVEQGVNALTRGAIYALIALGYTMVYGIIELINFAHGDMFMVGAFVSLTFLGTILGLNGPIYDIPVLVLTLAATFVITMSIMGLVGVVIERLAYKPLRNAPRLAPLITAIGVSFILQNIVQIFYGPYQTNSPKIFPSDVFIQVGATKVPILSIFIVVVAVALMIGLQLFIGRTRLGRAMRSTALDRDAAALMGVNINRTIAITFFIGSALAGAAGVVYGLQYGVTRFDLGFLAGLKAFTAAVLGGIGNTVGAALGGFIIGFIEVGAVVFDYGRWGPAIVFGVLVIVLVFRPAGLLGQQVGERA